MSERTQLDSRLDALVDLGIVESTEVADNGTVIATLVGDGPADLERAADDDVERIANTEIWGVAPVLYRPADPDDNGACEAIFVRGGDTREIVGTTDRRWTPTDPLAKGESEFRYMGPIGGDGQPSIRPTVRMKDDGTVYLNGVLVRLAFDDNTRLDVKSGAIEAKASSHITLESDTVNLAASSPTDAMALASRTNDRLDALEQAMDGIAGATPAPGDGGASIQVQLRAVWRGAMPGVPTLAQSVASTKVKAD